ncbi:MAG: hypothetical protein PF495_15720 [Spirochaetales bacterium]|jgi:hypothetical protein|nr:hypothetical protein [Spirochaetales bacterium]
MAAYAYEAITVAGTAIGFTDAKLKEAESKYGRNLSKALVAVETAQIRFTVDGTTPSTTVGTLLDVGDILEVDGLDVSKFLAIRATGTSGAIKVIYEV